MKECGGENRVISTADDSGMGMAHGGGGEHQMKECGEDRVILTAGNSGMGMAHGGGGEHQMEECGVDRVISTVDNFGTGRTHGKEGMSVKNVMAVSLGMVHEHYKGSALRGQTEMLPL